MGLDTTHGCWSGPYELFNIWRSALATAAGYRLKEVENDLGYRYETVDLPWDDFAEKNVRGEWDAPPDDPLLILLLHSDCDGLIHSQEAEMLAGRLEELLPKLPPDPDTPWWGPRQRTEQFIRGLNAAVARGDDVEFQ